MGVSCECCYARNGSINCGNFLTTCEMICFSRRTLLRGVSKYKVWQNIKGGTPGPAKLTVVKWQPHLWENMFRSE